MPDRTAIDDLRVEYETFKTTKVRGSIGLAFAHANLLDITDRLFAAIEAVEGEMLKLEMEVETLTKQSNYHD